MSPPTVALVTMDPLPPNAEHAVLIAALAQRGVTAVEVAWDHPGFDWTRVELAVLRSCWDYHLRSEQFLGWARTVPRLLNPWRAVEWNAHKRYLRQLEARSVPTVETIWVPRGRAPQLPKLLEPRGWKEAVVKPCISAGAHQTARCSAADWSRGQAVLEQICAEGEAMVQPWLPAVETSFERSLVFIDGVFSHAVRRAPVLTTGLQAASLAAAAEDERWVAEHALRGLELGPLLYARVDLIRDPRGEVRVMELELIEPSLFLSEHPPAAGALAEAIVRRLKEWKG